MLLREMTDHAFAHSFKRFAQLAVAGLAPAGLAACGGVTLPYSIPLTQAPAAVACFSSGGSSGTATCLEFPSGAGVEDCSQLAEEHRMVLADELVQQLQQCPRSSGEYRTITECRLPTSSGSANTFDYSNIELTDVGPLRVGCEANGGAFHIHQPISSSARATFRLDVPVAREPRVRRKGRES